MSGLLPLEQQIEFCRHAEEIGIESVLMALGFTRPEPIALSAALGMRTTKIKFMVACRAGLISPTLFVQQVNTVSSLTDGRICINMVTGHTPQELHYYGDWLSHDERYGRTEEFLTVCRGFWAATGTVNYDGEYYKIEDGRVNTPFVSSERTAPEIYVGGNSQLADDLAIKHADCLWRFPDEPGRLEPRIRGVLESGTEVGLLVSLLVRRSREQALHDAYEMIGRLNPQSRETNREFARKSDSVGFRRNFELANNRESEWLTDTLWTGAIPYLGAPAIALVGSAEEVAAALLEYKKIGISQFLFMGWPDQDEMIFFGREILPAIRKQEAEVKACALHSI
jgi:alkanesulfonate monooxygenase